MLEKRRPPITELIVFLVCVVILVGALAGAFLLVRDMQTATRGVTHVTPGSAPLAPAAIGVNVSLDQYSSEADLSRAFTLIHGAGFSQARQHFYWNEIEPQPGNFQWDQWDRIVQLATESGVELTAVLDTTPVWARDRGEADLVNSPPANVDDYGRFVSAFVQRYGTRVHRIQVWDNPNIHPFWGRRNADPDEYTALLRAGALAARAANPAVSIISAGLAPNDELIRGHPDYSDVLFLRGMYDAGARDYFDLLGAKPYGMWSGPDDRRVSMDVFNFSRAILLRDEMVAHGDASKAMWAVEFGWNALPSGWEGAPSPWGSDTPQVQSARLASGIERAHNEWGWMGAMFVQTFQPNAPGNDPIWGFALFDKNFQPTPLVAGAERAMIAPVQPAAFDFVRFYAMLAALAFVALVAGWRGTVAASRLPWGEGWRAIQSRLAALPETAQFAILALCALAFYYSPNVGLNFALLAALVMLFSFWLELGLVITVFAIPFYLLPKTLFGTLQFSMVEVLTLAAVAAWAIRKVASQKEKVSRGPATAPASLATESVRSGQEAVLSRRPFFEFSSRLGRISLWTCDLAVLFFVALGLLSVITAGNFGVANREFRVIVIEPALLYGLIRASNLFRRDLHRLVDAFILSAVAVSSIGLYQFGFTNWVIVGEGVRRVLSVYGSPNNLALYLDRALPLAIALALFIDDRRRRVGYALACIPIAASLYLTYSRGAWLIGLPAGLLVIGFFSGRRVRLAIAALVVVGVILLIPFSQTARFQSLFQEGTGTGFFRVSVWQSGLAMIRDHPIFGVGLDNFLYQYPKYIQPDAWREPNLSHPHNIILDFWVRMGIGGVAALAWFLFEFFRRGFRELSSGTNRALVVHQHDTPQASRGLRPCPGGRCQGSALRNYDSAHDLSEDSERDGKQEFRVDALVLGLMASMTAALAHGMIDAAYFYVDLAFVFMLTFGVMLQLSASPGQERF